MYGKTVSMVTCMHFWVWGILRRCSACAPTACEVVRDCRTMPVACAFSRACMLNSCLRSEDAFIITCVANLMEVKVLYVQQDQRYDISIYWRFNV
jgi:hypothetical protein